MIRIPPTLPQRHAMLEKSVIIAALAAAHLSISPAAALGPQFDSAATRTVPASYPAKNPSLDQERSETARDVTIGVINVNEPGYRSEFISPTLIQLSKALPRYHFRVLEIPAYQAADVIWRNRPDFLISPSDIFYTLTNSLGAQALATRKTVWAKDGGYSVGSAVVVREDRKDLQSIKDLKGKTVAASLPDSLGGWLALAGFLKDSGYDPQSFFYRVNYRTYEFPDVMESVVDRKTDAGVLTACELEAAEKAGLIESGILRVVSPRADSLLQCRHTTSLYPDNVFGALNFTRPELVKAVSVALLTMPDQPSFSWQVAGQLNAVGDLYKTLGMGPFAPKPLTFREVVIKYRWIFAGVALLIFILVMNEIRLRTLVRKRTSDLSAALSDNERLAENEREARTKLSVLERNSLVSHLSSMIAHELKQPLATIMNYCEVMSLTLEDLTPSNPTLEKATDAVNREAHRITDIVDRVRGYAREKKSAHKPVDLALVVSAAVENFRHYEEYRKYSPELLVSAVPGAVVQGDPLELEILLINLMKNAARAMKSETRRPLRVSVRTVDQYVFLSVEDAGPKLDDKNFRRLTEASDSTDPAGLGLGLGIVRGTADAHGALMTVRPADPHGVIFEFRFDRVNETPDDGAGRKTDADQPDAATMKGASHE